MLTGRYISGTYLSDRVRQHDGRIRRRGLLRDHLRPERLPCSNLTYLNPGPDQIVAYSQEECCLQCEDVTSYRNTTRTCTVCPFPSRCRRGACAPGATGDGCATCQLTPPRHFQVGQDCEPCPTSPPWLFILATVVVAVLIIAVVYKAAEVREDLAADVSTARGKATDAQKAIALGSSISNLSIYIGIVMPHLQILGAVSQLLELELELEKHRPG
eukprot:COSAG04_NODE_491_length_13463_cov_5.877432_12_plen_215_part_00